MERQKSVAREVRRDRRCRGRMGRHHLVVAAKDRPDDGVDEIVGQARVRHREILQTDGPVNGHQRRI